MIAVLSDLPPGSRAVVGRIVGNRSLARRLLEMGLVPGTEVYVERVAPLGDPIQLRLRGYSLSIRKADARSVSANPLEVPRTAPAPVAVRKP